MSNPSPKPPVERNMHKHLFKNVGGGCMLMGNEKFPCDDKFQCECGENFEVRTTIVGHTFLPEQWETQPMSEIKAKELESIRDIQLGGEITFTKEGGNLPPNDNFPTPPIL